MINGAVAFHYVCLPLLDAGITLCGPIHKVALYIVMAEEHHPRRDGQVELKSVFIPLLAKTVTVNGMEVEMKGYKALFVNAAEIGGQVKPAEAKSGK